MTPYEPLPTPIVIDLTPSDDDHHPEVDCGPMIDNPPVAPPYIDPENLELIRSIQRWRIQRGI
jgi:hypothetical protein